MENYHITTDKENLTIRTGKAEIIQYQNRYEFSGSIQSPMEFHKIRGSYYSLMYSVLQVDFENRSIVFDTNPHLSGTVTEETAIIRGQLKMDPDFESWKINGGFVWSIESLIKKIRLNRHFFSSVDQFTDILKYLMDFSGMVKKSIEKKDDARGNTRTLIEKQTMAGNEITFTLAVPYFKDDIIRTIDVVMFVNLDGNSPMFSLENGTLNGNIREAAKKIMLESISYFQAQLIPVLY